MKISRLISDLQRALENEGDLTVCIDTDGVSIYDIGMAVEVVHWSGKKELSLYEKEYQGN